MFVQRSLSFIGPAQGLRAEPARDAESFPTTGRSVVTFWPHSNCWWFKYTRKPPARQPRPWDSIFTTTPTCLMGGRIGVKLPEDSILPLLRHYVIGGSVANKGWNYKDR